MNALPKIANSLQANGICIPPLIDITLEQVKAGLEKRTFTSVDLVNAYVSRIQEVNSSLHVVTELNPDALKVAALLDSERANGVIHSPLHGIPILIKDNIATNDKMNNTAGSFALLGAKVPRDSTVAARLRSAGAILLGKANLSQWANYRSENGSNGWSSYGGQTYGAYHPKQDPCGSSSGSAVASSLGLALGALGTETDGSILCPAGYNNLIGIKPTVGLTSRYLVIPISEHQDTIGPMTRSVKDAAYILQAIAGPDERDNYTSAIPNDGKLPNYAAACKASSLKGARFGVPRNMIEFYAKRDLATRPIIDVFEQSLHIIRDSGATIIDANFTAFEEFEVSDNESIVLNADFFKSLESYLSQLTHNPLNLKTLNEIVDFTRSFPPEEFPSRDLGRFEKTLSQGFGNSDPRFWKAYEANQYLSGLGGLFGALERHDLDAVLMPTVFAAGSAAIVGAPVITVPMGFYPDKQPIVCNKRGDLVATGPNIPFGFSFLGKRWSEAALISYAYAFEQLTMARNQRQPYVVPNTEVVDVRKSRSWTALWRAIGIVR